MKKIGLFISLLSLMGSSRAQWTNIYNGQGDFSDVFNGTIVDGSGNTYLGGYTINPDLSKDILLVKLNNSGDTIWTRTFNGPGNGPDEATAITLDISNNILITGYQKGSGTGYDIITLKYNESGSLLWSTTYNYTTNEFDRGNAIITDNLNNVYIAGQSDKDITLNNNDDFIVAKYNASGVQQWVKRTNGIGNSTDRPSAIALDANNDVYVTGRSSNGSDDDYLTAKYNGATGAELWTNYFDRTHHDRATAIICNTATSNIYVTGRSNNGNNYDYVTICYNSGGTKLWQSIFDYVDDDRATNIGLDNAGNIYITGQSDIDASAIGVNYDILTVKYNSSGVQQFAQSFGGVAGGDDIPSGMIVTGTGNIYIAGTSDNDPSVNIEQDIIGLKYNNAGSLQWSASFNTPTVHNDVVQGIALDESGNLFIAGYSELVPDKNAVAIKFNSSGTLVWNYAYNGVGDNGDNAHAIIRDNANNIYLAGYTFGYEEDRNFLVMKIGASGTMHWAKTINGSSNAQSVDDAIALAIDNTGNIYATGFVKNSGTGYDIMLAKYSPLGDSLWSRQYNYATANETDKAVAIAIDASNNVYISGRSDQDATDVSNDDIITLKYNSTGTLVWEKRYNGTGNGLDNAKSIQISTAGNIYVAGKTFNGTNLDMIVIKYNSAGVQQWVKTFNGGFGDDEIKAINIDADENVYVTGNTTSATGDLDATIIAYNSGGTLIWFTHYDSGSQGNDEAKSITLDSEHNIIVAVTTAPDTITAVLNGDITVVKVSNTGEVIWDVTYLNALNDDASEAVVDELDNIIVTGQIDNGAAGVVDYDYLTWKLNSDGTVNATEIYNGVGSTNDVSNTLIAFSDAIYVTGGSYGTTSQRDIATLLYGTTPEWVQALTQNESPLLLYPNPAHAQFTIEFPDLLIQHHATITYAIIDVAGKIIFTETTSGSNKVQINSSGLQPGAYLIKATNDLHITTSKIIIIN